MSQKKDDDDQTLTRIEDLGEYLHELGSGEDFTGESDPFASDPVPETDSSADETTFSSESSFELGDSFASEEKSDATSSGFEFALTPEPENTTSTEDDFVLSEAPQTFEDNPADLPTDIPEEPWTPSEPEAAVEHDIAPMTPLAPEEITPYKAPETFEEVRRFAENSSFTGMAMEGNPSFSLLLREVRFIEDANDIISLLSELKLLTDPEDQVRARLKRGQLLIPRISEYAAVYLAHRLRRFDIDISFGPSDIIHTPRHQEPPEIGIVSKAHLYQNQSRQVNFDTPVEISQIIVAATPTLEGHQVLRYLGVASEHCMVDNHEVENEFSEEITRLYQELALKLKTHAVRAHANAVVGLNYQLTPLPSPYGSSAQKYRLSCTGNLVWVNKL
jgi:uncharacterized protein YbjQ (UPF0145 family)